MDQTPHPHNQRVLSLGVSLVCCSYISNLSCRPVSLNPDFPHIELVLKETTFGRRVDCDVVVEDPRISGRHCKIVLEQDSGPPQVVVKDLRSFFAFFSF